MTAHTCHTVTPGCYRCELGQDEVTAMHAEDYFEQNIADDYRKAGLPESALNAIRVRFVSDCVMNPAAAAQLRQWSFDGDADPSP